jgi:ABC-type branched-subunit amino acid transport system ATPase component
MSEAALTIRDVRAGYGEEDIVRGVTIDVRRGSIVAIIGPNGSGKSTLLKTIYGLLRARDGSITFFDRHGKAHELTGMAPDRITRIGLNMVPQLANIFPEMSVFENLEIGALPIRQRLFDQMEKVLAALPLLKPMLAKRAGVLSGGQRQMLALARALMSDPSLLILDEPSAGLAPKVQDEVFLKIQAINQLGVSVLMVEQRARQCLAIANFGYVLEQGRNRLAGAAATLLRDPEVIRLYVGAGRSGSPQKGPLRSSSKRTPT